MTRVKILGIRGKIAWKTREENKTKQWRAVAAFSRYKMTGMVNCTYTALIDSLLLIRVVEHYPE